MDPEGIETSLPIHCSLVGRLEGAELDREITACLENPVVSAVLDAVESYALILNEQRQILAANAALFRALAAEDPTCFRGLRPGEVFKCVHVEEGPEGCGTSNACTRCGALLTILAAQQQDGPTEGECLLGSSQDGKWNAREFWVRATPLKIYGHDFLVLIMRDISSQKRREALEQIFLHDLMNTLQGLRNWSELLQSPTSDRLDAARKIMSITDCLTEEVQAQRLLLQAERGELSVTPQDLFVADLFEELRITVLNHQCSAQRELKIQPPAPGLRILSDGRLLHRILLNMVINALEATPSGGSVGVRVEREDGGHRFTVHNPGCIPPHIASRIFLRSFSTKGPRGRGLGTYSMKLLGENILGGEVGFSSTPEQGTQFYFRLPDPG